MKRFLAALASVSLLAAPIATAPTVAAAQGHGGVHGAGAGGFHGSFRGAGFRGGGWRGGYGYYGYPFFFGGALLGFGLGAALFDPWYYGYPAYYGYGPYYGYSGPYDAPPPPPAPQAQAAPRQACGSWNWDATQSKYNWVPC